MCLRGGLLPYVDAKNRLSPFSTEGITHREAASAASLTEKKKPSPVAPLKYYGERPDKEYGRNMQTMGADEERMLADMLNKLGPSNARKELKASVANAGRQAGRVYEESSEDMEAAEAPRRRGRSRLSMLGEMRRRERSSNAGRDMDEAELDDDER